MKKFIKIFAIVFVFATLTAGCVHASRAANIVNVDFPCPSGNCEPATDIPSYLNNLYKFAVGISGLLALGMIVAGGVYYTVSAGNSGRQGEAKSMITSAIWGLVLLFASYLVLNTVNPQITTLGLSFGGAPPIASSSPETPLIKQTQCPNFSNIHLNPPLSQTMLPATCQFRKNFLNADTTIAGGDNNFYDNGLLEKFFGKTIGRGSVIWTYPYYIKGNDPATAQCLIFAYREPNGSTTITTGLNENLNLCPPQNQSSDNVCEAWNFAALSSASPSGPWVPAESGVIMVSGSFNYPDPLSPPPTVDPITHGVPGTSLCSGASYCKDRVWNCVSFK
jgi:hypothetical protein